jgi:hypothetical protein
MSGGEPLWRRVAGLYLSGIPADAGERLSTRASADAAAATVEEGDPAQQIVLLGEALDLVTLAQGYQSPVVPLLLRALIRTIRQVAAARAEAEAAAAATATPETPIAEPPAAVGPAATAPEASREAETPVDEAAGKTVDETATDKPSPETGAATAALEKRVKETDQKLSALTAAVGQLVDVLQRRSRDGGGVDRRVSPRIPGKNARVYVRDRLYEVVNWSKGGFQIRIAESDRFSRGVFDFHFVLDLPDEVIEFQGRARPVRIEQTTLAVEFASLDAAAAAKINEIAERLVAAG